MEGQMRRGGWHRPQSSRKPQHELTGRAPGEWKSTNPWRNTAQRQDENTRARFYQNSNYHGESYGKPRYMDRSQNNSQREHRPAYWRTPWHGRRNKPQQNNSEVEENTSEVGDNEEYPEQFFSAAEEAGTAEASDTDNSEGDQGNQGMNDYDELCKKILEYLQEKEQNGSEDGETETIEASDVNMKSNFERRISEQDQVNDSPEYSVVASRLINCLLKAGTPSSEQNLFKGPHSEPDRMATLGKLEEHQTGPIRFPIPKNFEGQHWSVKSSERFVLGSTGSSYVGQVSDNKMHGFGRLILGSTGDFIAGNWEANRLVDLDSCTLIYSKNTFKILKRHEDYLLSVYENNFVARVTLNYTDLDFNDEIWQVKEALMENLTTIEILQDDLERKRQESLHNLRSGLINMIISADPITRARTFILLWKYSSTASYKTLNCGCGSSQPIRPKNLNDIINDQAVPLGLKNAAIDLRDHDSRYQSWYHTFTFLKLQPVQLDIEKNFSDIYKDCLEEYRDKLISLCPSSLPSLLTELQQLDGSKIFFVTKMDIEVFELLAAHPFFLRYNDHFENLLVRFGKAVDKIPSPIDPSTVMPIMSHLIEPLTRSLWEIISETTETPDGGTLSMMKCDLRDWRISQIEWSSGNALSQKSLEIQCNVLSDILEFILPDNRISKKTFEYDFHVLEQDIQQHKTSAKAQNWLQKGLQKLRKTRGLPQRFQRLSEGRLVWLYLMDRTLHEMFKSDHKYQYILKQYGPLIQGQVRFIENSPGENLESFRTLTCSILKFIISSTPYVSATAELNIGGNNLGVDVDILFQHVLTASQNINHDPLSFSDFRDLIAEYNKYLELRDSVKIVPSPGYFASPLSQIKQTFMRIVKRSLEKSVPTSALVVYFRCLNDFLDDFRNIDFLEMWYVKTLGYDDPSALEKIDNKLSSGMNCSYRVQNVEKFVAQYQRIDYLPPKHYIILIVTELLGCIEKCLDKQWCADEDQLQIVQLQTTGILMHAIRRSFMYLKEQPDYVDFNAFKKESVEPFARLVAECTTLHDLKNRADIVKESFWYLRKMDEIDVDQALILLREANEGSVSNKLLDCYNLYLRTYNTYIQKYTCSLSNGESHAQGLEAVKEMIKHPNPLHFSRWTDQFKTKEIPVLLAGLSAIWSILVSKDLSGTGKFLKPHCIQILCILRLLDVGRSKGVENHLAQVLTGQGKSVILGLLSSLLALTGHKVRVLCYSKYLSSRDQTDFKEFFQKFRITENIVYSTFKDMAVEFLEPTCNGQKTSLRQLVRDKVLHHEDQRSLRSVNSDSKNTVLLIDEVDVFFTEHFYGNTYSSCKTLPFTGLAAAQEHIWNLVRNGFNDKQQIVDHTYTFIRNEVAAGNGRLSDLNGFLSKPGTFDLLVRENGELHVKNYTNQTLFEEHLQEMVEYALLVFRKVSLQNVHFKINNEGRICGSNSSDIYSEEWRYHRYWSYKNTFEYFKLKGSNYDHKGFKNYGYMILKTGSISYSLLPSHFRLILGVSGTLKNLGEYEKSGIRSYNIHNTTVLPSFYGDSNLKFRIFEDFQCLPEEENWLMAIYLKANNVVRSYRAALIFFESDLKMSQFTNKYRTKFDRLNEITTNTEPRLRDAYIEQAGLPGAVTLATRGMGRGVDYKSSLTVEKHGGVHVIQTFYSTDIKEEIQIKGRTARKDNKGSYEIVICKEHLVEEKIISQGDSSSYNYLSLQDIRQKLSSEKGLTVSDKIKQSESDHKTTMKYFGLA